MAVLSDNARAAVWADLMRRYSTDGQSIGINKSELRAAVDALDGFFHTYATNINSILPDAARNNLTTSQKALLLMYVVQRRYLDGA